MIKATMKNGIVLEGTPEEVVKALNLMSETSGEIKHQAAGWSDEPIMTVTRKIYEVDGSKQMLEIDRAMSKMFPAKTKARRAR